MANFEQFNSHFLDELLKLAIYKRDVCDIVCKNLDYSYIPAEMRGYKQILKSLKSHYSMTGKIPSLGTILQMNIADNEVHQAIDSIDGAKLPDKETALKTLEEYLKRVKFQVLFQKTADLYNNGKQDEAIELQATESPKISSFSIFSESQDIVDVFGGFEERNNERFIDANNGKGSKKRKIPFGIDIIDSLTDGGADPDLGEIDCFLGRSGGGKTKWLRWRGVSAARRGFKVLHIQAEGTLKECEIGYDSTWTGLYKSILTGGDIDSKIEEKLRKAARDIEKKGGLIEIRAFEQFDTASMVDVRNYVLDFKKRHGVYPDLLLLDYLELFHPGNGKRYSANTEGEKYRREDSARALKNICNEFKMVGGTASQANDVAPQDFNNSDWVMTRHNVAGTKSLVNPFSYFFTWNVSSDEYKKHMGRVYIDKMREFQAGQTIRICTDFARDRFYDRPATVDMWPEDYVVKKGGSRK